jgi:hypothetical protein
MPKNHQLAKRKIHSLIYPDGLTIN